MVYFPRSGEYIAVGVLGLLIYFVILVSALVTIWFGIRSGITKLFFASLAVMAVLEYPRYIELFASGHYDSKVAYSIHILAGNFFFLAFSIVCQQWATLLEIGVYAKMFYGSNGIFIANVVFLTIDIISMSLCLTSPSLLNFFRSPAFTVFSCIEAVKNFTYTAVLSYNGILLIRRLWNYSQSERQRTSVFRELKLCCNCCSAVNDDAALAVGFPSSSEPTLHVAPPEALFLNVVMRLTMVLVISTVCFLLRVAILIVKIDTNCAVTTPSFALFGVLWSLLSDFILRVLPSLAFMYLMRTKRPRGTQSPTILARQRADSSAECAESADHIVLLEVRDRSSTDDSVVTV
eukprot:gene19796-22503_t